MTRLASNVQGRQAKNAIETVDNALPYEERNISLRSFRTQHLAVIRFRHRLCHATHHLLPLEGVGERTKQRLHQNPRYHTRLAKIQCEYLRGDSFIMAQADNMALRICEHGVQGIKALARRAGSAWLSHSVLAMLREADITQLKQILGYDPRPFAARWGGKQPYSAQSLRSPLQKNVSVTQAESLAKAITQEGWQSIHAWAATQPNTVRRLIHQLSNAETKIHLADKSTENLWARTDLCTLIAKDFLQEYEKPQP